MKKTIWDEEAFRALIGRLEKVEDSSRARWGRFTADRMLSHLAESLRMALGELQCRPKKLPFRYTPLKQFVIYLAPFPKGAPTAPELLAGPERDVATARAEVTGLFAAVLARREETRWPEHPAFGKLTTRAWGTLIYRHVDHHLRQFGA